MKTKLSSLEREARDYELVELALSQERTDYLMSPVMAPVFQRWAGADRETFLSFLTKEYAQRMLLKDAFGCAGEEELELEICCETIKPGITSPLISYGTCLTPFGKALVALSQYGIRGLWFGTTEIAMPSMALAKAGLKKDPELVQAMCERIFHADPGGAEPIPVHLLGTKFQIEVWLALLALPKGSLTSYQAVARHIGRSNATRSVASAIARNSIGYLVPCHRVIQLGGAHGEYRWGSKRKQAMIGWEAARNSPR